MFPTESQVVVKIEHHQGRQLCRIGGPAPRPRHRGASRRPLGLEKHGEYPKLALFGRGAAGVPIRLLRMIV
jgi:hypothetical protein